MPAAPSRGGVRGIQPASRRPPALGGRHHWWQIAAGPRSAGRPWPQWDWRKAEGSGGREGVKSAGAAQLVVVGEVGAGKRRRRSNPSNHDATPCKYHPCAIDAGHQLRLSCYTGGCTLVHLHGGAQAPLSCHGRVGQGQKCQAAAVANSKQLPRSCVCVHQGELRVVRRCTL